MRIFLLFENGVCVEDLQRRYFGMVNADDGEMTFERVN